MKKNLAGKVGINIWKRSETFSSFFQKKEKGIILRGTFERDKNIIKTFFRIKTNERRKKVRKKKEKKEWRKGKKKNVNSLKEWNI
jgi:hypothetical protein